MERHFGERSPEMLCYITMMRFDYRKMKLQAAGNYKVVAGRSYARPITKLRPPGGSWNKFLKIENL